MTFDEAMQAMPSLLMGGLDPFRQKTVRDLGFLAQHEVDLYDEGEESDIKTKKQRDDCMRFARMAMRMGYDAE